MARPYRVGGAANWWAKLTPEERSKEMERRQAVARRNKLKKQHRALEPTDQSPFTTPENAAAVLERTVGGSARDHFLAVEKALANLKAALGY